MRSKVVRLICFGSAFSIIAIAILLLAGCGFAGNEHYGTASTYGFLDGIWHGLLAPWTLLLRVFMDIKMYGYPNSGWLYDFGFLIGIIFSIPIGWMAAIVAIAVYLL